MSPKSVDAALDRIASLRLAHLSKFAGVCASMVRDRDFRRAPTALLASSSLLSPSGRSSFLSPSSLLSPPAQTSLSPLRRRRSAEVPFSGDNVRSSNQLRNSAFHALAAPSQPARGRPPLPLRAPAKVHNPWGLENSPDPDFFFADGYSPGSSYRPRLRKVDSAPSLTATQLLRNVLGQTNV